MPESFFLQYAYAFIALISLTANIPLGYIRENYPKFSFKWFFWIHASIPFLVYLRISLDTSKWFIPVTILYAILGQIFGAKLRYERMSDRQREIRDQVPDIKLNKTKIQDSSKAVVVLLNMGGPKSSEAIDEFQKRLFEDPLLLRFPLSFMFQKVCAWLLDAEGGNR